MTLPATTSPPRQQLLERCVEHLEDHGFSDLSLRALADALNTSHRMLIYHFGSRDGLLTEVVTTVTERHQALLDGLGFETGTVDEVWQRTWAVLTSPTAHPRLFFELAAHTLHGRPWARGFETVIMSAWIDPLTSLLTEHGVQADEAVVRARLSIGVLRGLLLDRLVSHENDEVQAAVELFGEWMARP